MSLNSILDKFRRESTKVQIYNVDSSFAYEGYVIEVIQDNRIFISRTSGVDLAACCGKRKRVKEIILLSNIDTIESTRIYLK